jgi:23S rRNA pseudouridine2605 synthase
MKRKTDNFNKFYNKKRGSAIKEEIRQEKKAVKKERREAIERHFEDRRQARDGGGVAPAGGRAVKGKFEAKGKAVPAGPVKGKGAPAGAVRGANASDGGGKGKFAASGSGKGKVAFDAGGKGKGAGTGAVRGANAPDGGGKGKFAASGSGNRKEAPGVIVREKGVGPGAGVVKGPVGKGVVKGGIGPGKGSPVRDGAERGKIAIVRGEAAPVTGSAEQLPLNKYIAHSGLCSRRDAAELVRHGKVTVNGKPVTEPGTKVVPTDLVKVNGKKLTMSRNFVYILLNKPKDYITTMDDPQGRRTVLDLIRAATPERVYPVGRLDRNTSGVLLLTNDGDLAQKLAHPSHEIKKVYHVTLDKQLTKTDFDKIAGGGVVLEDGPASVDVLAYADPRDKTQVGLEIHSGRNRIVRRIFEHLGYDVRGLDRVMYAGLTKKNVQRGHWRLLSEKEVRILKYLNSSIKGSATRAKDWGAAGPDRGGKVPGNALAQRSKPQPEGD